MAKLGLLSINVKDSPELQAVILAVKSAPKNIQSNLKKYAKQDIVPEWKSTLQQQPQTPLQTALLVNTAQANVTNSTVNLRSGGLNASVGGGLSTQFVSKSGSASYREAEFGGNPYVKVTYQSKSRKGRGYTVHGRHTQAELEPYDKRGFVVYPAAKTIIPRIAALWVSTVVRTLHDAAEGKSS